MPERGLPRDLARFFIAFLLNTVFSVAVKRDGLYRTESGYKKMRSDIRGNNDNPRMIDKPGTVK